MRAPAVPPERRAPQVGDPHRVDTTAAAHQVVDSLAATADADAVSGVSVADLAAVGRDEASVLAVLSDLVGHAAKCRRPDTVARIEVTGRLQRGRVLLQVDGDGIGIHPDYVDRVSTVFARQASPLGGSRFCGTLPAAPTVDGGRLGPAGLQT